MDVGIHQPWGEVGALQVAGFSGVAAAAARMDAGNHLADDADVGGAEFPGDHINDLSSGE
ncbi:Uncharacterised protein [Raoultella terrigena]|uniref:Uncharacterized protein n=1 Tax=Raoultella terrigena TaxID=577 RepID=A0A4U9CWR7_RAOTE|nr:Uncharacterised protein [Raoultella terrigena]